MLSVVSFSVGILVTSFFVVQTDFMDIIGSKHHNDTSYFSGARSGLIVGIFNVCYAICDLTFDRTSDMYSRSGLMIVICIYIADIIQIASVRAWYQYFIGRIIFGSVGNGIAILYSNLIPEIAPTHLRGITVLSIN